MKRKLPSRFKIAVRSKADAMEVLKAFETYGFCGGEQSPPLSGILISMNMTWLVFMLTMVILHILMSVSILTIVLSLNYSFAI